jgi:hypothetical protein
VNRTLSLDEKLAGIGLMVSSKPLSKSDVAMVDIESTLAEAFIALLDESNLRLLVPVFTWTEVHGSSVIIEKLIKVLIKHSADLHDTSLAALFARFALQTGHKRWSTVAKKFTLKTSTPRLLGPSDMAASLVSLRGEESWAKDSGYRVAKGLITPNYKWVLSRKALAKLNPQYRNRLIYGPQWRADIITAYEQGAKTPAEASRISGASYEPCHRVKVELEAAGLLAS